MILIGIDDTDNKQSRGTGFRARQLGALIEKKSLGIVKSISRHQLFFDRRIPYTSQNSSACLLIENGSTDDLIKISSNFLIKESAVGSDAGLAIAEFINTDQKIIDWGERAKKEVLTQIEARSTADEANIFLEGYTGNKDGIIGALAAIGLRKSGNDGRCIWIKGKDIRQLTGIYTGSDLFKLLKIDNIIDNTGYKIKENSRIFVDDWLRPVIIQNNITIIVEKNKADLNYEYKTANKDFIKSISD